MCFLREVGLTYYARGKHASAPAYMYKEIYSSITDSEECTLRPYPNKAHTLALDPLP